MEKLREDVVDEDIERTVLLSISSKSQQDLMGWHYNDDEIYTVNLVIG